MAASPWAQREILQAVLTTLALGILGAVVTIILAFPAAWLTVRHPGRGARLLEGAGYLASSLPGIIIALALVHGDDPVGATAVPNGFDGGGRLRDHVHAPSHGRPPIRTRPGAPVLEEAARALGLSPFMSRLRVTLPVIAPSAAAGAALVALGIANELTATLLLAPNGTRTLATEFWTHVKDLDYAQAAPYALLMIALSLPVTWLLFRSSRLDGGR